VDTDGDGSGDACDCQPADGNDRIGAEVTNLLANRSGATTLLAWDPVSSADVYSVTRSDLSSLGAGALGSCLAEGVAGLALEDPEVPAPGGGFAYLVQAQNFDCGLGTLGYDSTESERINVAPGSCGGIAFTDVFPDGEIAVAGTVSGGFLDVQGSDDVVESIEEVISSGGKPTLRYSFLEHRWSLNVAAGSRKELHVEGFRTSSGDGDNFAFEFSDDGGASWTALAFPTLPTTSGAADLQTGLPAALTGSVLIRVVDTNRAAGGQFLDTVSVDELFVRVVP
jgi:hypothetical protein